MLRFKKETKLQGFSIFEILVTLGVILMLSALVFPFTLQKLQASRLNSYASQLVTDIYFQQQESYYKNSPRGISFSSNGYTIFDGESISTSTETSFTQFPTNISVTPINFSTGTEFYFPQQEFKPSSSGEIVLSDGFNTVNIYINREGLIYYE
jgi:Tfp pilus assembly protein FimT